MSKHAILTLTALITLGTSAVVTPPTLAAAKSVHRTATTTKTKHPKKSPKKYKIGKKKYTMKQIRKKYHLRYHTSNHKNIHNSYNHYDGKLNYANSGTFNMLTGKDNAKYWTSKKTKYYTFSSVYFKGTIKNGYWNYESYSIDAKTGHMYHYKSIGSAGGK